MGGLGGVKNGCKRGRGIATRREQGFFCFRGVSGVWGTLPVPHRIKGKLWNADNLWSISLALGWPNMEFYLISVEC